MYSKTIMASYATFKVLYSSKEYKSPYQILSEFIKYIITYKSLYCFTSTEICRYLNEDFGFSLPIAVIRTAIKNIPQVKRENQTYQVSGLNENNTFRSLKQKSEENSRLITDALIEFAEKKGIVGLNKQKLSQELIAFVLDENGEKLYQQVIGEFVLANESNLQITKSISDIREGSILYSGLAFNISEFGCLKQPITLFLDTEIIFDIAGLNGQLYQTLANDFLKLVDDANRGGKVISLKYFTRVEDEINLYYKRAERIVSGEGDINFSQAMRFIVDGCNDVSDVSDKKVDLFSH